MVLNRYEYSKIPNNKLPQSWQSQEALEDLNEFLQLNWEQRSVFYEDGEVTSRQQFLEFTSFGGVKTKKYIGTVVFRGEQLNIYPKIFSTDKEDHDTDDLNQEHLLYNLVKWVEYCNKMDYPFITISSELSDTKNLRELFISLYLNYVLNTTEKGLYYQYVDETNDCHGIKGKLDFKDYFFKKIPNVQPTRFQCTYSKFEYDNMVNRIIKYTCRKLLNSASEKNFWLIRTILSKLNEVSDVACTPSDCDKIRLSKMHKNYITIISMSKMFLLDKTSNFNVDNNESFCFLFPADLLFEGFVGGFINEVVSGLGGKVTLQESKTSLVNRIKYGNLVSNAVFTMRHDIVVEIKDTKYILDTKYKEISRFTGNDHYDENIKNEANQADLYQVITYASKAGLKDVYLLYPMFRHEEVEDIIHPTAECDFELFKTTVRIHFIRIPFVIEKNYYEQFKQQLSSVITSILS